MPRVVHRVMLKVWLPTSYTPIYVKMTALYSNSALSWEVRNTPKSNIWTLHKMREVGRRSVKGGAKKESNDCNQETCLTTQMRHTEVTPAVKVYCQEEGSEESSGSRGKVTTGKKIPFRNDKSCPKKEKHINPDKLNVKPQEGMPIYWGATY